MPPSDSSDGGDEYLAWESIPKEERAMVIAVAKLLVSLRTAGRFGKACAKIVWWSGWLILMFMAWKNGTLPLSGMPHP